MSITTQQKDRLKAVSMRLQVVCMCMTFVFVALIFSQVFERSSIGPYFAGVEEITPLDKTVRVNDPVELSVGLMIKDFPLFDMRAGQFIIDVSLFFVFDPRLITVERISDFSFLSSEIVSKSEPFVKLVGSTIFVRYDIRLKFDFDLYYQRFPFEGHRLALIMTHPSLTPGEVVYNSTRQDFSINPALVIPGWQVVDRRVVTGFQERVVTITPSEKEFLFPRPAVAFSLDFGRIGMRQSFTIFIPLLLLFLLAVITLSFAGDLSTSGIGLSAAVITALIGYRFVIENMSPKVGYLLVSDFIFLVFLAVACVIFLINIFSTYVPYVVKNIAVVLLHSVVVGVIWYYFLFF